MSADVGRHDAQLSSRFDGWKLYPYMRALHATHEIRGRYVYRCESGAAPEFEISRDRVYPYIAPGGPLYEIRDDRYVHAFGQPWPLFELRTTVEAPGVDLGPTDDQRRSLRAAVDANEATSTADPLIQDALMPNEIHRVLFICTDNAARSIMAEALMNTLGKARGFRASSAGTRPADAVHPLAFKALKDHGLSIDGLRSKQWEEVEASGLVLDFVVTLCDEAAGEPPPAWPGEPLSAHWSIPDPTRVEGTDEAREGAFMDVLVSLRRRIDLMLALPLASLDRVALHQHIRDIATQ
jgi:arsenate reductase